MGIGIGVYRIKEPAWFSQVRKCPNHKNPKARIKRREGGWVAKVAKVRGRLKKGREV